VLRTVPFVNNGVQRLSDEVSYFFNSIRTANRWSRSVFSDDFYDVVISRSAGLRRRFRAFWRYFHVLTTAQRNAVCDEYFAHNNVRALCNGQGEVSSQWKLMSEGLRAATSELFSFLYEQTLSSDSFREFSGECLRDHYLAFRAAYALQMCPFCGLEDYIDLGPELTGRDHYDHYLHKAAYPFASINFNNLYPMCHHCNSSFKKAKEVLFCPVTGARRRAPFPQDDRFSVAVRIERALDPDPKLEVELLTIEPPQDAEKFASWCDLLSIVPRYKARLRSKRKMWLSEILVEVGPDADSSLLSETLTKRRDVLQAATALSPQAEHLVRLPFLSCCIASAEALTAFFASEPRFTEYLVSRASLLNEA
jgi:hypothetical protein